MLPMQQRAINIISTIFKQLGPKFRLILTTETLTIKWLLFRLLVLQTTSITDYPKKKNFYVKYIYLNNTFVDQGCKTEKLLTALNKLAQSQSLHP